jgi:colanic acid biosynthesis glycosyl transferase WcaI
MRILFITHYFQPEPNFFMCLPFARELVRRGHEVEVLTGFPNYPGGRIYPGYHVRMLHRETMEGIPVIRTPLYPSHDNSGLKRAMCYMSAGLSAATIGPWVVKPADVAYVIQGPMTVGLPACVLRLLRRIPFVLHVHDLWPDSLTSSGMFKSPTGLKIVNAACNAVYKRAARIVSITPGMKRELSSRGVPPEKIEVIYNWCDDLLIARGQPRPELADSLGMAGRFNIVFAGNMGKMQALDAVLDAAQIVGVRNPIIQFVLVGSGVEVESLKQKAADLGLKNVLFLARRPISEIGEILRLADALLVHLKKDPLFEITIPSKTQAYLASGRPILIGVPGDATDLVLAAKAGLACEPENARSIADGAMRLASLPADELEQMGRNGMEYYDREISACIAADRFEKVFSGCARTQPKP